MVGEVMFLFFLATKAIHHPCIEIKVTENWDRFESIRPSFFKLVAIFGLDTEHIAKIFSKNRRLSFFHQYLFMH